MDGDICDSRSCTFLFESLKHLILDIDRNDSPVFTYELCHRDREHARTTADIYYRLPFLNIRAENLFRIMHERMYAPFYPKTMQTIGGRRM